MTITLIEPVQQCTGIYPSTDLMVEDGYPSTDAFQIIQTQDGRGAGVRALKAFARGRRMARVSGQIAAFCRLHTLQINAHTHLYDPHFSGLLLHSCDPNVRLDMAGFELWSLRDIAAGEMLTMDYASTEDMLMRQFECHCGAPNCRRWITGAKELPNETGQVFLAGLQTQTLA
ncbi:SET domain-containing protein-lysine N-methyltransferase [Burkholderia ubonensis]|uniref:SET domain-containing protein-lysine N-methyltransferase n=1 Tax=Burkholderia ubonensis TaxID=101571 RepID=UPI00075BB2CC|nr:SET domain-containing protein-lysine N-methyltransferase [Burkholderia ubonensis]KVM46038.1 SET domain-containing protein-lysine N-methyltransferase [Burkholderia ubonensis]